MTRTILIAGAIAALTAGGALAQSNNQGGNAAPDPGGVTESNSGNPNYGTIIQGLRAGTVTVEAEELGTLQPGSQVSIVRLSDLRTNAADHTTALDEAITAAEPQMGSIRAQIVSNADVAAALEAESLTPEDVIALQVDQGTVVLVVDDSV